MERQKKDQLHYLASILPGSELLRRIRVPIHSVIKSLWRSGGILSRKGLTAFTAATAWLWLEKVKKISFVSHFLTWRPALTIRDLKTVLGLVVSWYTGM